MRDNQKVFIQGNLKRGSEVIKILTDLGGCNSHHMNGKNVNAYYFINPNGIITNNYFSGSEVFSYVKEFYKEIQLPRWKPEYGDYYYHFTSTGLIKQGIWDNSLINDLYYEFGIASKHLTKLKQ